MARSVLVVDDEPNIVLSLEFLMRQAGLDVRTAGDGEAALRALADGVPDLVLLDVMMPKRDGIEVCRRIRAHPDWCGVCVVMLTAKGRESERQMGIAAGADDYIVKPFSNRAVLDCVESHVGALPG